MPSIDWLPMQQNPSALEGFQVGQQGVTNIIDATNRYKRSAIEQQLAQQELQHKMAMDPLQQQLAAQGILTPDDIQTNHDLAKAHLNLLGVQAHAAEVTTPALARHYDALTANLGAETEKNRAQADSIRSLMDTGQTKGGKPMDWFDPRSLVEQVDPNDPAQVKSFMDMLGASIAHKIDPNLMGGIDTQDRANAMAQTIGSGMIRARQQKLAHQQALVQGIGMMMSRARAAFGGQPDAAAGGAPPDLPGQVQTPTGPTPLPTQESQPAPTTSSFMGASSHPWQYRSSDGASTPPIPGLGVQQPQAQAPMPQAAAPSPQAAPAQPAAMAAPPGVPDGSIIRQKSTGQRFLVQNGQLTPLPNAGQ